MGRRPTYSRPRPRVRKADLTDASSAAQAGSQGTAVKHPLDHEKLDVYQIDLQSVAWSTERMVDLCNSAESKTRRIAETCDPLDRGRER